MKHICKKIRMKRYLAFNHCCEIPPMNTYNGGRDKSTASRRVSCCFSVTKAPTIDSYFSKTRDYTLRATVLLKETNKTRTQPGRPGYRAVQLETSQKNVLNQVRKCNLKTRHMAIGHYIESLQVENDCAGIHTSTPSSMQSIVTSIRA